MFVSGSCEENFAPLSKKLNLFFVCMAIFTDTIIHFQRKAGVELTVLFHLRDSGACVNGSTIHLTARRGASVLNMYRRHSVIFLLAYFRATFSIKSYTVEPR